MFDFHMPTTVAGGEGCVRRRAELLTAWGKRALLVTGGRSAELSGALRDVCEVLTEAGVAYSVFDKVRQNPPVSVCWEGGEAARRFSADFIVGIGGGSPLDAAKAVAAFATHPEREPMDIYEPLSRAPLQTVAIPTTAGTGSECNTYAVLTLPDGLRKKTFKGAFNFPKAAFLDPRYTLSLPPDITVATALDAFCHGVESFLGRSENAAAEFYALQGAKQVWQGLARFAQGDAGLKTRELLLYGAAFCGIAIQHTGTCFPHPMGYNLSLCHGIPHGTATGVFLPEFIRRTELVCPDRVTRLCAALDATVSEITAELARHCSLKFVLSETDIRDYVTRIRDAANFQNGRHEPLTEEDRAGLYKALTL